jgi:glutamate dehydrogenase
MQRRSSNAQIKLLEEIVSRTAAHPAAKEQPLLEEFARQFYRNVAVDDLFSHDTNSLVAATISGLDFAMKRKPGKPKIRVFNPTLERHGWTSPHTILEIVNDDMPFLVDSVRATINVQDLTVHLTIHPIMRVVRDKAGKLQEIIPRNKKASKGAKESIMRLEMDRESDQEAIDRLIKALESTLADVRRAVEDWETMREQARNICKEIEENPPTIDPATVAESVALIRWMADNHFTLLGYREYELIRGEDKDVLKPLVDTGLGILRKDSARKPKPINLVSRDIRAQARAREVLIITKANSKSTVHRNTHLDYVGIKVFDSAGRVVGEKRFLGLFTSVAYSRNPRDIPLLRHKVAEVMNQSGLDPKSHAGKALQHVLDTYPRDELFQTSVEELSRITTGILSLQERQRVKLFVRRDAFHRFVSCLVYVPRDKYNTEVRQRLQAILMDRYQGESCEHMVQLSDSRLARVQFIVRLGKGRLPRVDAGRLEDDLAEGVRTWTDNLKEALQERLGEEAGSKLFKRFGHSFPAAYMEDATPYEGTFDVERMALLEDEPEELRMSVYRPASFDQNSLRFKVCRRGSPIPLSDALPMLENMGLRVISERPYHCVLEDESQIWIQDFDMTLDHDRALEPAEISANFRETFDRIWNKTTDNDGFNKLVLSAGLNWRQAYLLRAYCRYLLQTGLPFSQTYMSQVMDRNAPVAQLLVELFEARFNPEGSRKRQNLASKCLEDIEAALDKVASQDEDRILRAFLTVINATLRTNFYQKQADGEFKPYVSIKLDPSSIPDLPLPRPKFEVWVYSPRMEGVHLRGGKVARGGLRWSDRMEDFRTEVLGLMKAQNVKNTLIVPVGAKGGFVCKHLPKGDRDAIQAEVIECYKSLIRGLLDITDNLVDGKVKAPEMVLRQDEDDYYLVVAADKGTATFSDIANSVSAEYNFWLGDAFASGGSAGYDHKGMGITAKGGWEAVKRHFREMGIDTQTTPFTVAGIGDMAGDVFGNGLLQSRHIRLLAAFNHMHIFLDPDPDPETSFVERERLFNLPRSSWADYDTNILSTGGGVFSRAEKHLELSPQVQAMLGTSETEMTPQQVMRAILCMNVDLLWNGGIGTYVKASTESHADAGDRANDALRINGKELRCKVIGEGGNLGLTQLGRIEYARKGGRLNTDFIDNSAGVDTSDREVNIKILLRQVVDKGEIDYKSRNKLLAKMTDEVGQLILRNNYLQTQAISLMEAHAVERLNEHVFVMKSLEKSGVLNRQLEFLPTDTQIKARRTAGAGFTRPELSLLVSYSKIALYQELIESNVPEDTYLSVELERYFPGPMRKKYASILRDHPLAREIVATMICNSVINRMGPVFTLRMMEETGADAAKIARAYTIAREIFGVRKDWVDIEKLDNKIPASVQYSMMFQITRLLRHATGWIMQHHDAPLNVESIVTRLQPGLDRTLKALPKAIIGPMSHRISETAGLYRDIGISDNVAYRMALIPAAFAALDITEIALRNKVDEARVAKTYYALGRALSLDWILEQIEKLAVDGRWQAIARGSLRENIYALQAQLTAQLLSGSSRAAPEDLVEKWIDSVSAKVMHLQKLIADLRNTGQMDFATLSVSLQEVRKLAQQG